MRLFRLRGCAWVLLQSLVKMLEVRCGDDVLIRRDRLGDGLRCARQGGVATAEPAEIQGGRLVDEVGSAAVGAVHFFGLGLIKGRCRWPRRRFTASSIKSDRVDPAASATASIRPIRSGGRVMLIRSRLSFGRGIQGV